jgi:hypothetical protein
MPKPGSRKGPHVAFLQALWGCSNIMHIIADLKKDIASIKTKITEK